MARHNGPTGDDLVNDPRTDHMSATIALPVAQTRDDTLLGASEAAAALGLDRYRSPMSVWLAKRAARAGEPPPADDKPEAVKEAGFWGTALEPVVRGHYAINTRTEVCVPSRSLAMATVDSGDGFAAKAWLRCTPDGFVIASGIAYQGETSEWHHDHVPPAAVGLLQVKTCSAYKADEWADGVPPVYEVQTRVEMAVCDLPWCDVVCLVGGQRYVGPFRVHRDAKLEHKILTDLRAFWQLVLDGQPPAVDGSEAWSSYASSAMQYSKVTIQADADCRAFMAEMRQAKMERARADRQYKELCNQILLRLGAAKATVMTDPELGKLTAFPTPGRMDWKAYAEHLERLVNDTTTWRGTEAVMRDKWKGEPSGKFQIRTPREWSSDEDVEE